MIRINFYPKFWYKYNLFTPKISLSGFNQDYIEKIKKISFSWKNKKKNMEEHELRCLIHELNTFTSNSYYLDSFEGYFYGNHSQVHYRMRNHQKIDHRSVINFRNFDNTQSNSYNDISFNDDGYETN